MDQEVNDCSVLHLGKIHNRAGNITVAEGENTIPFDIKRVYFLYDVPARAERGGHAHKNLYQFIVAASGSFNVVIDDGKNKLSVTLSQPDYGLYLVPGIWRELKDFSSGAICLVLASELYNESDYIREYNNFLKYRGCLK